MFCTRHNFIKHKPFIFEEWKLESSIIEWTMINNVNISTSSFLWLSFQGAPTMYESPNTPHAGSLSKIIVQSPEQEQQRRKNNQSSPHLCTVQKHLFSRESNKFTLLCANNKNNAENNRPMHKWNFKKTVDDNTSGSKNKPIYSGP